MTLLIWSIKLTHNLYIYDHGFYKVLRLIWIQTTIWASFWSLSNGMRSDEIIFWRIPAHFFLEYVIFITKCFNQTITASCQIWKFIVFNKWLWYYPHQQDRHCSVYMGYIVYCLLVPFFMFIGQNVNCSWVILFIVPGWHWSLFTGHIVHCLQVTLFIIIPHIY